MLKHSACALRKLCITAVKSIKFASWSMFSFVDVQLLIGIM